MDQNSSSCFLSFDACLGSEYYITGVLYQTEDR